MTAELAQLNKGRPAAPKKPVVAAASGPQPSPDMGEDEELGDDTDEPIKFTPFPEDRPGKWKPQPGGAPAAPIPGPIAPGAVPPGTPDGTLVPANLPFKAPPPAAARKPR